MNDPIIQFHHFSFQYRAQSEPTLHDIELEIRKDQRDPAAASPRWRTASTA